MLILRPVAPKDLDALMDMSRKVGSGMTTMPVDAARWESRIARCAETFAGKRGRTDEGVLFMVAEDSRTQKAVGTTAIYMGIGLTKPFYSYKISKLTKYSEIIKRTVHAKTLNLVNDFAGCVEIGSLYLSPEARKDENGKGGIGQFLSRARYLMLGDFRDMFPNVVIAELRGWLDENGESPFWNAVGSKFFDLSFHEADEISGAKGNQFIQDLMPKHPVYIDLLPESAQNVIAKPHNVSAAALSLLEKEGFFYDGFVDVFDGGPTFAQRIDQIHSVQDRQEYEVTIVNAVENHDQRYILSNQNLDNLRITLGYVSILDAQRVAVPQPIADALQVSPGDNISLLAMREKKR